ncbi:YggS family pyridoxal phosphate-dependent enzyme [Desulfoplanes formicivorans]|uniref:Pyridoxal phosphate homeostasis protein n=1 Tax=Desulfoplanes formicivorans TaxID=1592317 RepID=A0A194AEC4_9BACT|nr:YggS family pyridoxal phosphate-dependent enzyme [Desulfoplanes formicivorans]GAU07678.1 alanine racemase [Desulfoplanes formicivorans]
MSITENYQRIRQEIPDHVRIVLAAKTRTREEVREAIMAGATDMGENYVQEGEAMHQELGEWASKVTWHMIGDLQTNKINKALPVFDMIQTVDSLKKAQAVNLRAQRLDKVMPVLVEINIGSERTKSGLPPELPLVEELIEQAASLSHISIQGLMTMGPRFGDPEVSRPYFRAARKIFDTLGKRNYAHAPMKELSMGMSNTYKVAIEEGATMVRLGTCVFGPREACRRT